MVPLYTNPLQIGKLLQLQQWPNCPRFGGTCHQPHILCKPDMAIVLEEIQLPPPAQAQVPGQAPPGGPGGPAQPPTGPPASGSPPGCGHPPTGGPSTSGQGAAQEGNDDEEPEEDDDDDDPYAPDDEYPEDYDDDGNYEIDEEEEGSTDQSEYYTDEYDDIYDDENDDNDDVRAPAHGEKDDDNDDPNDETNPCQKRKCESPLKQSKKRKTGESSMPLQEHEERVETIVYVPREHEMEEIAQDESLLSPELTTPHVQNIPPRRRSPRVRDQSITEPIPATPLEFAHRGTERKGAKIKTPQNPSSERNPLISRKLVLSTPLGANPQQSTSTGGENIKKIPGKGAPKTPKSGQRSRHLVVPSGDGGPSGRGHGPAPTGAPPPVAGVVTRAVAGGGGGGVGAPVVPVQNAQYIYRSPLVIFEIEGKKVSWDHNKYASKAFCAMACGLALHRRVISYMFSLIK